MERVISDFPRAFPDSRRLITLSNADDHALVQERLGVVYGVLAAIVLGLWALSTFALVSVGQGSTLAAHLTLPRASNLATGLALLAAHKLCQGELRSAHLLALLDMGAAFLFGAVASLSVGLTRGVHAELMNVLAVTLLVTLRAALVPTPLGWTMAVVIASAAPTPIGTWWAVARDLSWDAARVPRGAFVSVATTWMLASLLTAWAIARVVHGLRVEIKAATKLGPYTLEEKIGEGAMGVVYRARHALLRRPTAIKLLAPERTSPAAIRRFEREVQLTSALTHPNTVAIYDFGQTRSGVFYYAMELLTGASLQKVVEDEGPMPSKRVAPILRQIAEALAEAHAAGLVHRDIKPANVFLCQKPAPDFVKVLDFGLVKDTGVVDTRASEENTIKGTPQYMAPESILTPDLVDARVDIYALGVLGYFLLTGATPFTGRNVFEVCTKHITVTPEPPSSHREGVDPELESLVMRCLAKTPTDRPDAHELSLVLRELRCG